MDLISENQDLTATIASKLLSPGVCIILVAQMESSLLILFDLIIEIKLRLIKNLEL